MPSLHTFFLGHSHTHTHAWECPYLDAHIHRAGYSGNKEKLTDTLPNTTISTSGHVGRGILSA